MPHSVACVSLLLGLTFRQGTAVHDWKAQMELAQAACQEYANAKEHGAEQAQLEESKQAARGSIKHLLMGNFQLFNQDSDFRSSVMPRYEGGGKSLEKSSRFIQACFATEHLELRSPWGYFMEALAMDKGCRQQTEEISEFEGRCFPSAISNAMDSFQWSGELEEMSALYDRAKAIMGNKGRPLLRWKDPMMHPMITISGLRNRPIWRKQDDPIVGSIMTLLEENVVTFQRELAALRSAGRFSAAYDHLVGAGDWNRVPLYVDRQWDESLCKLTPATCALLRGKLPGEQHDLPHIVNNHEEVAFFYAGPSSRVLPHSGQQNVRINVHIGLEGFDDSKLIVYTGLNKTRVLKWTATSAFAFNDGWQHEVVNGEGHRYVLAVGVMHPDLDEATYASAFKGRTFAGPFKPGQLEKFVQKAQEKRASKKRRGDDAGEL